MWRERITYENSIPLRQLTEMNARKTWAVQSVLNRKFSWKDVPVHQRTTSVTKLKLLCWRINFSKIFCPPKPDAIFRERQMFEVNIQQSKNFRIIFLTHFLPLSVNRFGSRGERPYVLQLVKLETTFGGCRIHPNTLVSLKYSS